MPWKLQWFDVREISVAITLEFRGNCLGVPWQLPRIGELPWQLPRMAAEYRGFPWKLQWIDVHGNCRGNCREGPSQLPLTGGLPWQLPRMAMPRNAAEIAVA